MPKLKSVVKEMTNYETKLIGNAIRRKKLFLVLSIIGVIIALCLGLFYLWEAYTQSQLDNGGLHFVVVLLILLNARQNLRQYHYAKVLEQIYDEASPQK